MLTSALAATALLTRIPIRRQFTASDIAAAVPLFPIVGAFVGGTQVLAAQLLRPWLTPPVVSAILLGLCAAVTGGLHLDGLADCADGFGGGRAPADVLRIMRDPAIGSYGATLLVVVLSVRLTAIAALIDREALAPWLLLAPVLGRWAMVAVAASLPYARPDGLGSIVGRIGSLRAASTTLLALAICAAVSGARTIAAFAAALLVTMLCRALSVHRIGGYTGDVLGATNELTEAAVLIVGVGVAR